MGYTEAFQWNSTRVIRELQDMGVDENLITIACGDIRILRGLYMYVLEESEYLLTNH